MTQFARLSFLSMTQADTTCSNAAVDVSLIDRSKYCTLHNLNHKDPHAALCTTFSGALRILLGPLDLQTKALTRCFHAVRTLSFDLQSWSFSFLKKKQLRYGPILSTKEPERGVHNSYHHYVLMHGNNDTESCTVVL